MIRDLLTPSPGATPYMAGLMAVGHAVVGGAIGSTRTGLHPLLGEIALAAIWSTPIHEDATALANLVAALNGLAAL